MSNRRKVIVVGFYDRALGLEYISGLRNKFNNSSWVPIEPMNPFEFETPYHSIRLVTKDGCGRANFILADYAYGPEWLRTKVRAFAGHTCEYSPCPPNLVKFIEDRETEIVKIGLNSIYGSGIYDDGTHGGFTMPAKLHVGTLYIKHPEIKKVHFSGPVTCVIWTDGTKTLVRCQDGETLDPEKGLAMAISKKFLGTNGNGSNYYDEFKKWLPKKEEEKKPADGMRTTRVFVDEPGPKYELTAETKRFGHRILRRIRAARNIYSPDGMLFVKKGEFGGWIERETNLSHHGSCWISENAKVMDQAEISGNAYVHGYAIVKGNARVTGRALVRDHASVVDSAIIAGEAYIHDSACISGNAYVLYNANVGGTACVGEDVRLFNNCTILGKVALGGKASYKEVTLGDSGTED